MVDHLSGFGETSAAKRRSAWGGLDKGVVFRRCVRQRSAAPRARPCSASRADSANARRRILGLTEAGRERLAGIEPLVDVRNGALHALFDEDELKRLHAALDRLTDHLARELDDRAEPAVAPPHAAQ